MRSTHAERLLVADLIPRHVILVGRLDVQSTTGRLAISTSPTSAESLRAAEAATEMATPLYRRNKYSVCLVRQWIHILRQSFLSLEEYPIPRILKSIPRELCGNAKYHCPSCQCADWMCYCSVMENLCVPSGAVAHDVGLATSCLRFLSCLAPRRNSDLTSWGWPVN